MLDKTIKSLNNSEVIKRGSYDYFVNPLTDGCPAIDSSVIDEITDLIISRYDFRKITKIVTMEAMGIPITAVLSCKLGIPYNIVRKRSYGLIGEVEVDQVTGYSTSKMYINGVNSLDNLFIFDVIVSTGGTLKAVLGGLRSINASISQVCCLIEKYNGTEVIKSLGYPIDSIIHIDIDNSKAEATLTCRNGEDGARSPWSLGRGS